MEIIGITGPTGAGKSTVCKALAAHGFEHLDADAIAKSLYVPDAPVLQALQCAFGVDILRQDGTLNRKALAAVAFATPQNTARLNAIVHPVVTREIRARLDELRKSGVKSVIIDAIALFESGENELCDRTVGVIAPKEIRMERIRARDNLTAQEAALRIDAQPDEAFYTARCDVVLRNYPPYSLEDEIQRIFQP